METDDRHREPEVCPSCRSPNIKIATETEYVVYYRCDDCQHTWSIPRRDVGGF